jgi:3-phenylpropionate/trans-cinnamate dioxygenase ferredoxin subunit
VSLALAFIGVSVLASWGLASVGLIACGIVLFFFPGMRDRLRPAGWGVILFVFGLVNLAVMIPVVSPLLGLDPPFPIRAKSIKPREAMTRWANAGFVRDLPSGVPVEKRLRSQRVTLVRMEDNVYALNGLCSHARLPLAGIPLSPIKADPIRDNCVMCPFHGARFDIETGRVVRQPFSSEFNNDHPFLGRLQSKLFRAMSAPPTPSFMPKPSMRAEDLQTYPVRIEGGEIQVALPK